MNRLLPLIPLLLIPHLGTAAPLEWRQPYLGLNYFRGFGTIQNDSGAFEDNHFWWVSETSSSTKPNPWWTYNPEFGASPGELSALRRLRRELNPGDYVFTWWDYAQAIQHHAGANVVCGVDSQTDDLFFIAKGLFATNQLMTANLARLVAEMDARSGPAQGGAMAVTQILENGDNDANSDGRDDVTGLPLIHHTGPRGILRQLGQASFKLPADNQGREVYLYLTDNLVPIAMAIRQFSNRDLLDANQEYQLGLDMLKKREPANAKELFQQAAEKGHGPARIKLAGAHLKSYMSTLKTPRAGQLLSAQDEELFKDIPGLIGSARKRDPHALKGLATIWLRQQEKGHGQSLLKAYQWSSRPTDSNSTGPLAPLAIRRSELCADISIHLDGLSLLKPEDLPQKFRSQHKQITGLKKSIDLQAAKFKPRGPQRRLPLFMNFSTIERIASRQKGRSPAILLKGFYNNQHYLAVRQDLHVYRPSSLPKPKPDQLWAVMIDKKIVSGMFMGEERDKKTGDALVILKASGTAKEPNRNIALPKNRITKWFEQWLHLDGMTITDTHPDDPKQLKIETHDFDPRKRRSTGHHLVLSLNLYDPPGANGVAKFSQPLCIMHSDLYHSTLVQLLLVGNYDKNLFDLVLWNKDQRIYRVRQPRERDAGEIRREALNEPLTPTSLALGISQRISHPRRRAHAFTESAMAIMLSGNWKRAHAVLEKIPAGSMLVVALRRLALKAVEKGLNPEARNLVQLAYAAVRKTKPSHSKTKTLLELADATRKAGDLKLAKAIVTDAREAANAMGNAPLRSISRGRVALALAQLGEADAARILLGRIQHTPVKAIAAAQCAAMLFKGSDEKTGREFVAFAKQAATKVEQPMIRATVLCEAAAALANAGAKNEAGALALAAVSAAEKIQAIGPGCPALRTAVQKLAQAGLPNLGRNVLERLAVSELKRKNPARAELRRVASLLAEMNYKKAAVSLIQRITPKIHDNGRIDERYNWSNAKVLAEAGDAQSAVKIANTVKHANTRAYAYRTIAWALAQNGDQQRAAKLFRQSANFFHQAFTDDNGTNWWDFHVFSHWKTAAAAMEAELPMVAGPLLERTANMAGQKMVSPDVRAKTRLDIARTWVLAGDLKKADAAVRKIKNDVYQAIACSELAMAHVAQDDFKSASELADLIKGKKEQAWLRLDLATSLARAGKPEAAMNLVNQTAQAIQLRPRDLQPIAHSLATKANGRMKPQFTPCEKKLAKLLTSLVNE